MFQSSSLLRYSSLILKRYFHLSIPSLTAGQTQYHGQQDSTWWDKYSSHVDPVQSRTDLLNMEDLDERHFRPIKPVIPTYQSFSCFHDPIISRVIGILVREGNRELVEELIHKTFRTIKLIQIGKWQRAKTDEERLSIQCNPIILLKQAIKNATPIVRLTRIAKGGTLYSVPIPMSPTRGTYTAIRLLIDSTHDARPHDQRFWTLFAKEIMDAAENQGLNTRRINMSQFINKLLGRDDESESHSHHGESKHGRSSTSEKHDSKSVHTSTGGHTSEGRTVQHGGVNIKSTISSDASSTVSLANQQKLNDLVSKLGSTHNQIDEYAKQQTIKINEEIQREIDQVVGRTRQEQDELLRKANEHTSQIDAEYRARLQKMVEEVDATKAKRIAGIEQELNKQQADILQTARNEIDQLNQKAANLKIGVLQQGQAKAAADAIAITAEASHLGQASTVHQSTGTTTIKTEVSAAATTKDVGGSSTVTATKETHSASSSASDAK